MMTEYLDCEELVQVAQYGRANAYLKAGYRLISVSHNAQSQRMSKDANVQWYVRKFNVFVLGRPAGVEHFEPSEDHSD